MPNAGKNSQLFLLASGGKEQQHRVADCFLRGVTEELLCSRIPTGYDSIEGLSYDGVLGGCDDGHEPQFRLSGPLAFGNVAKDNCNLPLLWLTDAIGTNLVEAIQGFGFVLEMLRLASECDHPIDFEPILLMGRSDLTHSLTHRIMHPGLLFKCSVDPEESIVCRLALRVEKHLDDAEPFIHRVKQTAIEHFARAQLFFSPLSLVNVRISAKPAYDLAVGVQDRHHSGQEGPKDTVGAPQRESHFERRSRRNGVLPLLKDSGQSFRVKHGLPSPTFHLFRGGAGKFVPSLVVPEDEAIGVRHPA